MFSLTPNKNSVKLVEVAEKAKPKNEIHIACQRIVTTFLRQDVKPNWAREIKMAKKLLADYPFLKDWTGIPEERRAFSLNAFLTEDGKKFLTDFERLRAFNVADETPVFVPNGKIFGETKEIELKPRSLMEFLRYGKT